MFMSKTGYCRLEDTFYPDEFRLAKYSGAFEMENVRPGDIGHFILRFDCKPQRFYKFGDQFITLTNGQILHNPSPFTAKPILVVQGSGEGTISDGTHILTLSNCANKTIDCDSMQIYQQIGSTILNMNRVGSGAFPELAEGDTRIFWSGGITGIKLKPRWWTI